MKRFLPSKRLAAIALFGGIALTTAIGAWAHGSAAARWMHADAGNDPAAMAEHVDRVLEHVYVEVGASDTQKTQLSPLLKQAVTDLQPLRTQFHAGHQQMLSLLTQAKIDRTAVEQLRNDQLRIADDASRRIIGLLVDVADILTPEQRRTLAERIRQHHGVHAG